MPKRVIDFDAMWGSDKIASCAEWAQAEYAWLYGLADPSGCFELTNPRVIWGRVAAIRRNLTIERLEQVFDEFKDKGLLFVWEQDGKVYGHWTGSDVPGRLPPPSWRMRLERLAPPVPKKQLAEYMANFSRGRAASAGGRFSGMARREGVETALKGGLEETQEQDLDLYSDLESDGKGELSEERGQSAAAETVHDTGRSSDSLFPELVSTATSNSEGKPSAPLDLNANAVAETQAGPGGRVTQGQGLMSRALANGSTPGNAEKYGNPRSNLETHARAIAQANRGGSDVAGADPGTLISAKSGFGANCPANVSRNARTQATGGTADVARGARDVPGARDGRSAGKWNGSGTASAGQSGSYRDKWEQVQRELRVGQGPSCGPVRVKPEALERIRLRNARREGPRSP